jgi:hypothetical protein
MRAIFEFPLENAKVADWVADDAVLCELLSTSNSLSIRKNTGNFAVLGLLRSIEGRKSLGPLAEFPTKRNREFSGRNGEVAAEAPVETPMVVSYPVDSLWPFLFSSVLVRAV